MKKKYTTRAKVLCVVAAIGLSSCSTSKVMVNHQEQATLFEAEGNYASAVSEWNTYFAFQQQKGLTVDGTSYAHAAQTALKAGDGAQAESWYSLAEYAGYSDEKMLLAQAGFAQSKNALPQEQEYLMKYVKAYPEGAEVSAANARLFELYVQTGQNEKALVQWNALTKADQNQEQHLEDYFNLLLKTGQTADLEQVANKLVAINPQQVKSLEWLAEYHYRKAEESYQFEMDAYKKKHTHLQYLKLTQQLKVINTDFQQSLEYFNRLWEIDNKSTYASYMSNIYARFENKEKSAYYRQLAN